MAKLLRQIVKKDDALKGVKSSVTVDGSTGTDPGVDYDPKAPDDQKFVKLHKTEKHADRVGNGEDVYNASKVKKSLDDEKNKRMGYKKGEDEKVNEETDKKKDLYEIITKKTSSSKIVDDFVNSKNPKFDGKSKAERIKMALGAYYSKHPEKSKKLNKEDSPSDGQIYPSKGVPNKYQTSGGDTPYAI